MRIYSIDGVDPFLPTLAERICDGTLWPDGVSPEGPLALANVTVYLPTRRAARALGEAILTASGRSATVLPKIEALGEGEDDAPANVLGDAAGRAALAALLPPFLQAVGRTRDDNPRALSRASPAELIRLAGDLLSLMDQVETQEADWTQLPALVVDADLAEHWRITTRFLDVATKVWPDVLTESGRVSAASARRESAHRAAARAARANGPLIVAGSTGSIPATRRLIRAIGESPWGAIVLPAFDLESDDEDWRAIRTQFDGPSHPQFGMIQLLDSLDCLPSHVKRLRPIGGGADGGRHRLIRVACRPAAETERWRADRCALGGGAGVTGYLSQITLVEAPDERHEAAALAIALRESIELGERAALITPDRGLARRVKHRLARWGLVVDDSAGEALVATSAGQLVRLLTAVAAGGSAAEWLGLLKHPVLGGRFDVAAVEALFRGRRVPSYRIVERLVARGGSAAAFAGVVSGAIAPLVALGAATAPVAVLASATREAFDALGEGREPPPGTAMIHDVLDELASAPGLSLTLSDWPAALDGLMDGRVQRGPSPEGAVAILGPLEARLIAVDHAVLGGLNEGTWPATADAGPWMSRRMMAQLGLDLPERRIGLAGHDVTTAMMRPRVTLGRTLLAAGEPAVASRWWQRLAAFAGEAAGDARARGRRLVDLAVRLDHAPPVPAAPRPEPRPPVSARPRRFRVTDVGLWVRDPYAFYARRILRLKPLESLDAEPDAGDRGNLVHSVMQRFAQDRRAGSSDALAAYHDSVRAAILPLADAPDAQALWGAWLTALAPHVMAWEADRPERPMVEVTAETTFAGGGRLLGRIDRLDCYPDGTVEVVDFKTGAPPSAKQVASLIEPQLPLEGALVMSGAVEGLATDTALFGLTYVQVGNSREPLKEMGCAGRDAADELARRAMDDLARLLNLYDEPAKGYLSRARVTFDADRSGDYDHLARVAEWQQ